MRIVIDLQAGQAENRSRGIGRYSLSLASAMAHAAGDHEIWLALNGNLPESVEAIRHEFDSLIPQERIRTFSAPSPVTGIQPENAWRSEAANRVREAFLADLHPDFVHTSSMFDGLVEDAVTSIGQFDQHAAQAVTLYDLIPLLNPVPYLENQLVRDWYHRKLQSLKRADLVLAISESSRDEAINGLYLPPERVVNISAAVDPGFRPIRIGAEAEAFLRQRYALGDRFVMYTGGIDPRKNIEGLISAFALLPPNLRQGLRLAVVCSIRDVDREALCAVAAQSGLGPEDVAFTGFVPEAHLVALYNLCTLFVFPSLHEGFGLPALEAMACGAPAIGSDNSSIPEVIGRSDALFNAHDPRAIAAKIAEVLLNEGFSRELRSHGLKQAATFSWDASARRAINAMEIDQRERMSVSRKVVVAPPIRLRLAYVSPVPPEQTGIASYSAELLPELARYYDIEIISNQETGTAAGIHGNHPIRNVAWFEQHADKFDRILYQFGNSDFHTHMFGLLKRFPGTVVLHDFFLSGMQHWREHHHGQTNHFSRSLLASHGYHALIDHLEGEWDTGIWRYPVNHEVLEHATGVIVHSGHAIDLTRQFYGDHAARDMRHTPHLRIVPKFDRDAARKALGLIPQDYIVCSFGHLVATKLNTKLLDAFLTSDLAEDPNCRLVFVGQLDPGPYCDVVLGKIEKSGIGERLTITGFATPDLYESYLRAADLAVQLRSKSRGETSGAALDCLAHGVPTIVNAHGTMAELPPDVVRKLPDIFSQAELISALEQVRSIPTIQRELCENGLAYLREVHSPAKVGLEQYRAIEYFADESSRARTRRLIDSLRQLNESHSPSLAETAALAKQIAENSVRWGPRELLVDISELVQRDAQSGIQRVVKSILGELLRNPPVGYRVEPVYIDRDGEWTSYRYARQYALKTLGCVDPLATDDVVNARSGDVLLGLDLSPHLVTDLVREGFYQRLRSRGVALHFVVYDLLPVTNAGWFVPGAFEGFSPWIAAVASVADGLMCISHSVMKELRQWLDTTSAQRQRPVRLGWFHLGADSGASVRSKGLPAGANGVLAQLALRPSLLMVGTLEPRKGHAKAIDAFERMWKRGDDANLVIVGKQGWMVEELVSRLQQHPELGHRLFWVEGASDEYLEKIYAISSALLAASEGEGFGLPLIEAAQHGLPIVARDMPVFREVAGDHAFYFAGDARALADALQGWLVEYRAGRHPRSDKLPWKTWAESATQLTTAILNGQWESEWRPDGAWHYRGSDPALNTVVGYKRDGQVVSTGKAGHLLFGPYIAMPAGKYVVNMFGTVAMNDRSTGHVDVAINQGELVLGKVEMTQNAGGDTGAALHLPLTFTLMRPCTDLEIRMWVHEHAEVSVSRLEIRAVPEQIEFH